MPNPILLYSPIFDFTAENFTEKLLSLDKNEDSETWINTPGGSVFAGWSIVGALKLRKEQTGKDNNAIVMGDASSMGVVTLLFMDNVKAIETANFIVHRADGWVDTEDEIAQLKSINKEIRSKLEKKIDSETFEKVTGVSFDEVFSMEQRKNVHLTAKQAKQIGLVDKIIKLEPSQIAAIANIKINDNKTQNKMSIKDKLLGRKPLINAKSGESTIAFRELEMNKEVEAIGSTDAFSGIFEHENKTVTVVDNKITAIVEKDEKDLQIQALQKEIKAIKETSEVNEDVIVDLMAKYADRIEALEKVISDAKLTKSDPKLPVGEFKEKQPEGYKKDPIAERQREMVAKIEEKRKDR